MKTEDAMTRVAEITVEEPPAGMSANKSPNTVEEDANMALFKYRNKARGRMAKSMIELATVYQPMILDVQLADHMDPRDIIPVARILSARMIKNGGAGLLTTICRNRRPDRLWGCLLTNESFEKIRVKFAKMLGVRPTDIHAYRPKKGAKLSSRLSMIIMAALSTNPANRPKNVVTGELQAMYEDIATTLAELSAASTSSLVVTVPTSKSREGRAISRSSGPKMADVRKCLNCGKPIGKRGNRADYCKKHASKKERRRFSRQQAQARAQLVSSRSKTAGATRSSRDPFDALHEVVSKMDRAILPLSHKNDVARKRGSSRPLGALGAGQGNRTRRRPR